MYLHTPVLEVGSWWRVDTASGTNTPTTVYAHDGADAIPTSLGASGSTVRDSTRDGTGLFWSTAATLYCKELTYQGVPTGTVVTSTGVTPTTPSGAPSQLDARYDAAGAAASAQSASLQKTSNLSDLASAPTARTNLGLGTAATQASTAFDAVGSAAVMAIVFGA